MKSIIAISIISAAIVAMACTSNSSNYCIDERPKDIPEWVEWDCVKKEQYKRGEYHISKDSSIYIWGAKK